MMALATRWRNIDIDNGITPDSAEYMITYTAPDNISLPTRRDH